ncbi:MAG: ABC transporter substrate-binding protein [Pseudomonadota bacterium]
MTDTKTQTGTGSGFTRRGLMQTGAAGALLLGMGMPALAEPKRGGKMRMGKGHGQTSDSPDPGTWENGFTLSYGFAIYNRLTEVDVDGSLIPELAESWEASADATQWTFKIRDAKFHDDTKITAADVIASMNHHRGEESQSAAKPIVSAIKDIEAVGDNAVKFTLDGGNADFPFVLTDYHLVIGKDDGSGKVDWNSGIGSGTYVRKNFEPGIRLDLVRHENNWRKDRGWFDEVEMLAIVDPVARQNALMTGAVDAIDRVDVKTVNLLKRNPNLIIESVAGTQHFTFPMRVNQEPFNDNNIRMALKLSVKRQEMLDKVLQGYGALGNDIPLSSSQRFFNSDIPQRAYDPEKAKWHLKQAGAEGLSVDLHAANAAFPGAIDAASLYAASASEAGIKINVIRAADDGYWSNIWNNKGWCACYWGGRPIEDLMFSTAYQSGVPWNDTAWSNERFDELLLQARAELDENLRREMYYEMQVILHDTGGLIAPMFASYVSAIDKKVQHGPMASNWPLDGERWMERWWFA